MAKNRLYMIVQSALILLLVIMLSSAAIRIFLEGDAIQRGGDLFYWIYTRDRVAERFAPIAPLLFAAIGMTVAGWLLGVKDENAEKPKGMAAASESADPPKHAAGLQMILIAAAVLLILAGALNGSALDVLYKAITICTECIGLG